MLSLTQSAKAAISGITSQSGLPETGGVRITLTQDADQVELSLVPQPESSDEVIDEDGARIFVEDVACPLLDQHTLDAETGPEGIGFALRKAG